MTTATDHSRAVISIDPGLDRAAAAFWRLAPGEMPPVRADTSALAGRLVWLRQIRTASSLPLQDRLHQLHTWAAIRLREDNQKGAGLNRWNPVYTSVVVEWPAFAGMHRGRTRQRSSTTQPTAEAMAGLYASIGAIVGGLSAWCDLIVLDPAAKVDRKVKQAVARSIIDAADPTALNNDDTRSAVFVGVTHLCERMPSAPPPDPRTFAQEQSHA